VSDSQPASPHLSAQNPFSYLLEHTDAAAWRATLQPLNASVPEHLFDLTELLDAYLQQVWTEGSHPGCLQVLLDTLRKHTGPAGQGYLALGQINPAPGDLAGNARQIMRQIAVAEALGLDAIVFPELALMGYPIRDVIVRHPFIVQENVRWLNEIAARTGHTRVLLGFVEPRHTPGAGQEKPIGKPFYNALAVLGEGKIEAIVRKSLLPTYHEYEDDRTFEPSPRAGQWLPETFGQALDGDLADETSADLTSIHGVRYGLSICEDIWNDQAFFERPLYARDPIQLLAQAGPDALINVSASVTRSRKEQMKHNMLSHLAREYGLPLLYVNQAGSIDETSFDGASRVYGPDGALIARARSFQPQFMIVHPKRRLGRIYPLPAGLEATLGNPPAIKRFWVDDASDLGRTYESLLQGIRDYFRKTGFSRAVLGLSGGIDSAVTATLLADALGPQNVLAVSMPSRITPAENRSDAAQQAENLGIGYTEIPIAEIIQPFLTGIEAQRASIAQHWGGSDPQSYAADNVQAISRATLLRLIGNDYRALPIATSDKSELYMGYATINGDMTGALAPLGDVTKTKLRALAHWMNANRPVKNAIPEAVITRPPAADLALDPTTGRPLQAEAALMPYPFLDEVIWRIETLHQSKANMLNETFEWELQNGPLPLERKRLWLDRFFRRMATAVFKWWVVPPILIVDGNGSIAKTDYHHPITACRIAWEGTVPETMSHILNAACQEFSGARSALANPAMRQRPTSTK
jgi:NAD+ synthetase